MNQLGLNKQETKDLLKVLFGDAEKDENYELKNEQGIIASALPPVDLRSIPLEERQERCGADVTVPEHVKKHLAKCVFPLSPAETGIIEDMMEEHHQVKPPHCIVMEFGITGKVYTHLPEVANYVTGFTYIHEQPIQKIPRHSKHSKK
jgi:hypothetical protein